MYIVREPSSLWCLPARKPVKHPAFGSFSFHCPEDPSLRPQDNARYARFQEPFETPRVQQLSYLAGGLLLRYPFRVTLRIDPQEVRKLRETVAPGDGNILVGPHPDVMDGLILYRLFDALKHPHDALLMASDQMSRWLLPVFRCLKVLGVHRGNSASEANQHSKAYIIDRLTQGGWAGLLSEGCVSWSRTVVEMRKGAVEMALNAALKADGKSVYITPLAIVYFHSDPAIMQKRMEQALQDLEELPQVYAHAKPKNNAPFQERLEKVAHRLLDHKAHVHGVALLPEDGVKGSTVLKRILSLKSALQKQLEGRYGAKPLEEAEALWLMNLRARLQIQLAQAKVNPKRLKKLEKQLNQPGLESERRRALQVEIALLEKQQQHRDQLERDLARVTDFKQFLSITSADELNMIEPEDQATLLRKLMEMMKLRPVSFGPREAVVKILPPLRINDYILQYQQAASAAERNALLVRVTRSIQQDIQKEIRQIVAAAAPTPKALLPQTENAQPAASTQTGEPIHALKQPV